MRRDDSIECHEADSYRPRPAPSHERGGALSFPPGCVRHSCRSGPSRHGCHSFRTWADPAFRAWLASWPSWPPGPCRHERPTPRTRRRSRANPRRHGRHPPRFSVRRYTPIELLSPPRLPGDRGPRIHRHLSARTKRHPARPAREARDGPVLRRYRRGKRDYQLIDRPGWFPAFWGRPCGPCWSRHRVGVGGDRPDSASRRSEFPKLATEKSNALRPDVIGVRGQPAVPVPSDDSQVPSKGVGDSGIRLPFPLATPASTRTGRPKPRCAPGGRSGAAR